MDDTSSLVMLLRGRVREGSVSLCRCVDCRLTPPYLVGLKISDESVAYALLVSTCGYNFGSSLTSRQGRDGSCSRRSSLCSPQHRLYTEGSVFKRNGDQCCSELNIPAPSERNLTVTSRRSNKCPKRASQSYRSAGCRRRERCVCAVCRCMLGICRSCSSKQSCGGLFLRVAVIGPSGSDQPSYQTTSPLLRYLYVSSERLLERHALYICTLNHTL